MAVYGVCTRHGHARCGIRLELQKQAHAGRAYTRQVVQCVIVTEINKPPKEDQVRAVSHRLPYLQARPTAPQQAKNNNQLELESKDVLKFQFEEFAKVGRIRRYMLLLLLPHAIDIFADHSLGSFGPYA